jgi:DNA-binding response OmpR family regulator
MKVLVVEDDPVIGGNVCDFLAGTGMSPRYAPDGLVALVELGREPPDAIVLDLNLPGIDGIDWCRRLRAGGMTEVPVLMLTARDSIDSKRAGFEAGADDYLVKPFVLEELAMRLRALARRHPTAAVPATARAAAPALAHGRLRLDLDARCAEVDGRTVRLTPRSLRLLELLLRQAGRVCSRADLEREIWGEAPPGSDALRALVAQTRRAFVDTGVDPIENLHGHGYRIRSAAPLP